MKMLLESYPIGDLINRFGKKQKQVKFNIVDGRWALYIAYMFLKKQRKNKTT